MSAPGHVQLLKYEPDIVLYGLLAQLERCADLLIRFSLGHERANTLLLERLSKGRGEDRLPLGQGMNGHDWPGEVQ